MTGIGLYNFDWWNAFIFILHIGLCIYCDYVQSLLTINVIIFNLSGIFFRDTDKSLRDLLSPNRLPVQAKIIEISGLTVCHSQSVHRLR